MSQKSYDNSPTLYLIPTPIGNMEDITIRALNILKMVDVIFCEDTRVTGQLLKYFNIEKKLISSHNYNEANNKEKLIEYLSSGSNVGLVSDRGTPIISDPGYELAKCAIENNYNVVSLPGATALIPALTSSGLNPMPFYYYGFLNSKDSARRNELETLKNIGATVIFYEAPHRITKTLENIKEIFGNREGSLIREISKKYEEIIRGNIDYLIEQSKNIKGEIVVVVEGNKIEKDFKDLSIINHINIYLKEGKPIKEAIKQVSIDRNIPKNEVYKEYHTK